jgi:hypothetical protein
LFELLDENEAVNRCEYYKPRELSLSNQTFCNQPAVVAKRKLLAEERAEYQRREQSGENAAKAAEWAAQCAILRSKQEEGDKLPMTSSAEDQSKTSRIAVDLAACAAIEAM